MTRTINNPTIDKNNLALGIVSGGTSDITPPLAAQNIGLITVSEYNAVGGVVQLDASGKIPANLLASAGFSGPTIQSDVLLVGGNSYNFIITNYDFNTTYNLTVSGGVAVQNGDTISYRAPTTPGTYTLDVNNNVITLTVQDNVVKTPVIQSPTNLSIENPLIVNIQSDVYSTIGSLEIGTLLASDGAVSDLYGHGVSISGDGLVLAVGTWSKDTVAGVDAGQVYIYDWDVSTSTWIERSTLLASDGTTSDGYGVYVSLNSTGAILAVGALWKDTVGGVNAGQVYIYDWDVSTSTWIERSKILASDAAAGDEYGLSTALDSTGTILAVGARFKDTVGGIDAGQVYIYDWNGTTWVERSKLIASDGAASDLYGWGLSLSGNGLVLAVGAQGKDTVAGVDAGQVYIYDWDVSTSTWIERSKILASDAAAGDSYGVSTALNSTGTLLAIGAIGKDTIAGVDAGQVYIYDWNGTTWIERSILLASDAAVSDQYGISTALNSTGTILAVGAHGKDTVAGIDAGQVYTVTPSYHVSSDWQLSTDPGFSNIVVSSLADTTNLENWIVNNLVLNTNYYARVRYHSLRFGTSPWSDTIEFTTKISAIPSIEINTIRASDAAVSDLYGHGVSVSRDGLVLAVGAPLKDTVAGVDAGQVYIYDWNGTTWIERSILLASDGAAGDVYGATTALNSTGTILAVGAYVKDTIAGVGAGQVYIYDWNGTTWIERSILLASDGAANDYYGMSTALNSTGTILAVGALWKDTIAGSNAGQVYIYDWDGTTWIERSKILASDGAVSDQYGISTALDSTGTILAVGAYTKDTIVGVDAGQVYIYDWDVSTSTWIERSKLLASDGAASDLYGASTALDSTGTILAVGAYAKDTIAGSNAGQVYIYDWDVSTTTWIERSILLASDAAANDNYGRTIGLSGDAGILAVGAHGKDTLAGVDAGQVYTYV